ncbi:MAG: hypothetical protein RLZZ350_883 [Verrucomicrobiota bacterium]|jgi:IS30 family transposase
MPSEIKNFLTAAGIARALNVCPATVKRRIQDGDIEPDGLLVESAHRPGSAIFHSERLPEISVTIARKPNSVNTR